MLEKMKKSEKSNVREMAASLIDDIQKETLFGDVWKPARPLEQLFSSMTEVTVFLKQLSEFVGELEKQWQNNPVDIDYPRNVINEMITQLEALEQIHAASNLDIQVVKNSARLELYKFAENVIARNDWSKPFTRYSDCITNADEALEMLERIRKIMRTCEVEIRTKPVCFKAKLEALKEFIDELEAMQPETFNKPEDTKLCAVVNVETSKIPVTACMIEVPETLETPETLAEDIKEAMGKHYVWEGHARPFAETINNMSTLYAMTTNLYQTLNEMIECLDDNDTFEREMVKLNGLIGILRDEKDKALAK